MSEYKKINDDQFISEGPTTNRELTPYNEQQALYKQGFISSNQHTSNPFSISKKTISTYDFISEGPKTRYDFTDFESYAQKHSIPDLRKTTQPTTKKQTKPIIQQTTKHQSTPRIQTTTKLQKAATKSKKTNTKTKFKPKKKKIDKGKIIASILLIMGIALISPKVATHIEGEQTKKEIVQIVKDNSEFFGIDFNNLENSLLNLDEKTIKNDMFIYYLIINDEYNIFEEERSRLKDELAKKIEYKNFDDYILKNGYFDKYDGINYPSIEKWENHMEKIYGDSLEEIKNQLANIKGARK